jgi:hypothetical protein
MSAGSGGPGDAWLAGHSWHRPTWTVAELTAAKRGRTVSVVLPALNEALEDRDPEVRKAVRIAIQQISVATQ